MNNFFLQIIMGQIRHALTAAGASLVTSGLLSHDEVQAGVAALITLAGLAWSGYEKWKRKQELENNGG